MKNRNRSEYSFANINLLGKCNVDCFFCLGKDIEELLSKHNQLGTHYIDWKNFNKFLNTCRNKRIYNLYITGLNMDALLYTHLEALINHLQDDWGFDVGLRTNGYLAYEKIDIINKCKRSVGYSIHTLIENSNYNIMKKTRLPKWGRILPDTKNPRVSIVVNRYNHLEIFEIIRYLSQYENIKYIQLRRVSTDTRKEVLKTDQDMFEHLANYINLTTKKVSIYEGAPIYKIYGMNVILWRTVATTANSINYFTDGTISNTYFIVEGYLEEQGD